MNKKRKYLAIASLVTILVGGLALFLSGRNIAVLNPQGTIARQERELIIIATLLGLLVVIPVFIMTFMIAWKYRESNSSSTYSPDWDHSRLAESVWWGLPCVIIVILSVITWNSSHALDPFKPLQSNKIPMTIQVVALDWKWLFIYPDQNIATVNYVQFPKETPVNFEITADAPMNSFWIPQLGGQIYAMPGMSTHLHLMADGVGSYSGSSANLSGKGFAEMRFTAKSSTEADFNSWAENTKTSANKLNAITYDSLSQPSVNNSQAYYSLSDPGLYNSIIAKYMGPMIDGHHDHSQYGDDF